MEAQTQLGCVSSTDDKFMRVQNLNAAVTAGCQTVRFFELVLSHKPSFDSGNISHTLSSQNFPLSQVTTR